MYSVHITERVFYGLIHFVSGWPFMAQATICLALSQLCFFAGVGIMSAAARSNRKNSTDQHVLDITGYAPHPSRCAVSDAITDAVQEQSSCMVAERLRFTAE